MHGDNFGNDKGLMAFTQSGGVSSDAEILATNKRRYRFVEVGSRDAHQVKCYDCFESRYVWGSYKAFSETSREMIFVPNN